MTRRPEAGGRPTSNRPGIATPAALGFHFPAEWEPHRATWLVWPHNRADWGSKTPAISWCYAEIVRHLTAGEQVAIIVQHAALERRARSVLTQAGVNPARVEFHRIPTNRSWIRDSGPLFLVRALGTPQGVERRELALTDWAFNGWARYADWKLDNRVPARIAHRLRVRRFVAAVTRERHPRPVVLEGGSVDVNGEGLLLTTEECLLSPVQARNRTLSRDEIEEVLRSFLGVQKVLWLSRGIAGDDTHGHIDALARFVGPGRVAAAIEEDPGDENYEPLRENLARLEAMSDLAGRRLEIVPIPMPRWLAFGGQRLPASYLNFYIGNRSVLVPTFNDPHDRVALQRLAELFPDREVVGIHAVDLVVGLGTIHCLTQQEPSLTDRAPAP